MGSSSSDAPDIPTAGEDLTSVLKALKKGGEKISAIERREVESSLDRLAEFGPEATRLVGQLATQQAQQDISRVGALAPSLREATADPLTQEIRQLLSAQITEGLQAGSGLTEGMRQQIENQIRAGQGARGNIFGAAPVAAEAFAVGAQGEQLLRNRQSAALSFLQNQAQTTVDPLRAITGLGAATPLGLAQPTGAVTGQIPSLLGLQASRTAAQFNADQSAIASRQGNIQGIGTILGAGVGFGLGGPIGAGIGGAVGGAAGGVIGGLF